MTRACQKKVPVLHDPTLMHIQTYLQTHIHTYSTCRASDRHSCGTGTKTQAPPLVLDMSLKNFQLCGAHAHTWNRYAHLPTGRLFTGNECHPQLTNIAGYGMDPSGPTELCTSKLILLPLSEMQDKDPDPLTTARHRPSSAHVTPPKKRSKSPFYGEVDDKHSIF